MQIIGVPHEILTHTNSSTEATTGHGVYKSSLTNFQEISTTHLTKFQQDFYTDQAS